MDSKHILVTGGGGFIGSHLVERLLREGKQVTVIDDFSTGSRVNLAAVAGRRGLRVIPTKVSECRELSEIIRRVQCAVHLAAAVGVDLVVRNPIQTIHTNLHETEVLLAETSRHRIPTLLASTSEVYGRSRQLEFSEEDDLVIGPPVFGRWSYACSKLMDEFLAMAYCRDQALPVIVVRLFNTVGPRQTGRYGMVLPRFVEAAVEGRPLRVFGDGTQSRCFCDVRDTVEALVRLMRLPAAFGEVFNVGSTEEVSIMELARHVIKAAGSSSTPEPVPYEQAYAKGFQDMRRRRPRVDKLHRYTGFRPETPLNAIIKRMLDGYRAPTPGGMPVEFK